MMKIGGESVWWMNETLIMQELLIFCWYSVVLEVRGFFLKKKYPKEKKHPNWKMPKLGESVVDEWKTLMQRAVLRFSVDVLLIYSVVLEPEGKKKKKKRKKTDPKDK